MINALAHIVTAIGAGWSHSQEWMPCQGILRNSVHHPQPVRATSTNVNVADKQCKALQGTGLRCNLERVGRVGGRGRFSRTQGQSCSWIQGCS